MKPPQEDRVVAVYDAALAHAVAVSVADGSISVLDGETNAESLGDTIVLGYGDEAIVVTCEPLPTSMGVDYYRETVRIVCTLWSWSGSVTYAEKRARCRDMLSALRDRIRNDPNLGGACSRARLGVDLAWRQELTENGTYVGVGFTIEARTDGV